MFGDRGGGGVSLGLVGWLWADILLGLFVLFLAAANGAPTPDAAAATNGISPTPITLTLVVDGPRLLGTDTAAVQAEQQRVWTDVVLRTQREAPGKRVALALAYAAHESPVEGDRLAKTVTDAFRGGAFEGAVIKTFHELVPGDRGTSVQLELYLYE